MTNTDDRIALQDVMLNYAAGIDERDQTRYRACFSEDVEVVDFSDEVIYGASAWLTFVWQALTPFASTQHMLGPMYAELNGDQAQTRSDLQALHVYHDSNKCMTLWGTYHSRMLRQQNQWKIIHHRLVVRATTTQQL